MLAAISNRAAHLNYTPDESLVTQVNLYAQMMDRVYRLNAKYPGFLTRMATQGGN